MQIGAGNCIKGGETMILNFILTILLILSAPVRQGTAKSDLHSSTKFAFFIVGPVYGVGCISDQIQMALGQLSSGEYTQIEQVRNTRLSPATTSPACSKE